MFAINNVSSLDNQEQLINLGENSVVIAISNGVQLPKDVISSTVHIFCDLDYLI